MLDPNLLADKLYKSFGHAADKDGNIVATDEIKAYAKGLVTALQTGLITHTAVTGQCVCNGGQLQNGMADGGKVIGATGSVMSPITDTKGQFPKSDQAMLKGEHKGVLDEFFTKVALISFESGNITGTCGCTPVSAGPFVGEGKNGKWKLVEGPLIMAAVVNEIGMVGPDMPKFYQALADFINDGSELSYANGNVTGSCPAGGGSLAGTGIGGTIK
jgi:hypothetical protein